MEKRVGVYLRVSTKEQNTDLQRHEIISYLNARSLCRNVVIYEDTATGTNSNRPELQRLLYDAKTRKIDMIVCWKLDRLFRSLKNLVTTLQDFSDVGVEFISLKDQIDMSTASGRLMTHLLAAFSEFEADLIKERVLAGLSAAKRNGKILGRPKEINEEDILKLRRQGKSITAISNELNISRGAVHKSLKKAAL
jgi:DNA invertase Pin-like site-specific DNA recombinase